MILATFLKSIPWCHVVVGILFMGSWTRDSPYLPHVDSVASSFRILVTFAIVLEVRGISFFQIPWTAYGRSSFETKYHNQSALDEFSILYCESASSTFCMGYPEEMLSFARHTNLCIHNSESYMYLWVVPLPLYSDLRLSIDSEEYVCIRVHRRLVFLWFVKPFCFRMTGRNKLQYLIHIQDWVKAVVIRRSKCNPAFGSVLPWSITHFMSGASWELHLLLWILDAVILLAIIVHSSVPVLL